MYKKLFFLWLSVQYGVIIPPRFQDIFTGRLFILFI